MKNLVIGVMCGLLALSTAASAADQVIRVERQEGIPSLLGNVPDEFVLVLKPDVGPLGVFYSAEAIAQVGDEAFDALSEEYRVTRIRQQFPGSEGSPNQAKADLARFQKVRFDSGELQEVMAAYARHPFVESVEPIGIHAMRATPNDTYFSPYQTYHHQSNDHDIDSPEAWDLQTGSSSVIVAILDSGTRYYHPDLGGSNASVSNPAASRGNMWINTAELNGSSGVDDDGNGYTDDWIGYDFIDGVSNCWSGEDCNTQDNDPRDFNGHGTHTAGIFGMITNDGYGMAGVAGGWNNGSQAEYGNGVRIMPLRMGYSYNYLGQEYGVVMMDAAAEAFYYAANSGAKVASCSWGSSNSGGIGTAATYFINSGGLIFVAAGNDGSQTADYLNGRGDCISVAAVDVDDSPASFTTYGTWVDICAPGVGIYSTYHDHTDPNTIYWAALDGTSMATPMAAGVGALIWSQNPGWTASQVESQLFTSAENIDAYLPSEYIGKMGAGRINSYNAVNTGPPPPPVAEFSGTPTTGTEPLTVSFTDLSSGSIDTWSWTFGDGGTSAAQSPSHQYTAAGSYTVSLTVTGPGGSDTETKTNYITVDPCVAPVADFSGAPTSGPAPLIVDFTDLSAGAPDSWSWTFGDGGTSSVQNPSHAYPAEGDYTVTLSVTNACGSDQMIKTAYIHVDGAPPVALAEADLPVAGTVSGSYTDTHTADNGYEVITEVSSQTHPRKWYSMLEHQWRFTVGGGSSVTFYVEAYRPANSDGDDFTFAYSTDGSNFTDLVTVASATEQLYTVSMPASLSGTVYIRVVDTDHTKELQSLDRIYIDYLAIESISGPVPPVANFEGVPTSGYAPLIVQFTDLSSGAPTAWSWTFGEGGTSTQQSPTYQYDTPGTYTVTLTATNAYGSDDETKTGYITVLELGNNLMHVSEMAVSRRQVGNGYKGTCTTWIVDQANAPLANATVHLSFTGPSAGTMSGVTGADGAVSLETGKIRDPVGEWCFEVTGVTHATHTYDPGADVVTIACESGPVEGRDSPLGRLAFAGTEVRSSWSPSTHTIFFSLPEAADVRLDVFNVAGGRMATLAQGHHAAGVHSVTLNAAALGTGIYFYRFQAGEVNEARKVMVIQ